MSEELEGYVWAEVIADRFDHFINPTRIASGELGDFLYIPEHIRDLGVEEGKLRPSSKPEGRNFSRGSFCRVC